MIDVIKIVCALLIYKGIIFFIEHRNRFWFTSKIEVELFWDGIELTKWRNPRGSRENGGVIKTYRLFK